MYNMKQGIRRKEIFMACIFQTALVSCHAGYVHVVKLCIDRRHKLRLCLVFLQLFGLIGTVNILFVYVIFILKLIVGLF